MICFPECFVPGYRWPGTAAPPPDPAFLERAWAAVADAARAARITVILGTERVTDRGLQISACVINPDGTVAGWQDKGQIDPSEEADLSRARDRTSRLHRRAADLRCGDLPRRLALSGDRAVGRASRRAGRVSPTRACRRTRELSPARRSPIPPTHSTRKPCCAARRRTRASSRR